MITRKKHFGLIQALARSFHQTTGIDWKELVSEASLGYCEALRSYRPARGQLVTWVYTFMKNRLILFAQAERDNTFQPLDGQELPRATTHQNHWFERYESLSEESRMLADMVLRNPHRYLDGGKQQGRRRLTAELLKTTGWSYEHVRRALRNMKQEMAKQ